MGKQLSLQKQVDGLVEVVGITQEQMREILDGEGDMVKLVEGVIGLYEKLDARVDGLEERVGLVEVRHAKLLSKMEDLNGGLSSVGFSVDDVKERVLKLEDALEILSCLKAIEHGYAHHGVAQKPFWKRWFGL